MSSHVSFDGRGKASAIGAVFHGLWAAPIALVMAPGVLAAQESSNSGGNANATTLPEIRVIATTPVAPPRVTAPAPTPAGAASPAAVAESTTKPVPGAVDQDKIPSNVQTVSASAFDHAKA